MIDGIINLTSHGFHPGYDFQVEICSIFCSTFVKSMKGHPGWEREESHYWDCPEYWTYAGTILNNDSI